MPSSDAGWDCILVPGGGLLDDGSLPPWTLARLERTLALEDRTARIGLLSGGTVHKAPPLDPDGFPVFESRQAASFLIESGIQPHRILTEICSYDTIGNAYFSRLLLAEPFQLQRLHIITSAFHLARSEAIFHWVFSLAPRTMDFQLSFESTPDRGISPPALQARLLREKHSLENLQLKIRAISSLDVFHPWLYTEHAAYCVARDKEQLSQAELGTY